MPRTRRAAAKIPAMESAVRARRKVFMNANATRHRTAGFGQEATISSRRCTGSTFFVLRRVPMFRTSTNTENVIAA